MIRPMTMGLGTNIPRGSMDDEGSIFSAPVCYRTGHLCNAAKGKFGHLESSISLRYCGPREAPASWRTMHSGALSPSYPSPIYNKRNILKSMHIYVSRFI